MRNWVIVKVIALKHNPYFDKLRGGKIPTGILMRETRPKQAGRHSDSNTSWQ